MNIKHLNVGILHSLIGKNDGVSIVIDQTVNAMVKDMGISLGNIYFLAAHTSPRFNAETDDIFWHKNSIHKKIIRNFSAKTAPHGLDKLIHEKALYARDVIARFIDRNDIDLLIAHNTSHPYNFITAVGLGYYLEDLRAKGVIWPNVLVWWHDSYFERKVFSTPNPVIQKYLEYLPGTHIDGIAFINKTQVELGKRWFKSYNGSKLNAFFRERVVVIPNTSEITWDWKNHDWDGDAPVFPLQDNYNDSFFDDVGLTAELKKRNMTLDDAVILLQHTRVVPRKQIEIAIDLAFELEKKYLWEGLKKCVTLLVSGHSGDEQFEYKKFLKNYFKEKLIRHPDSNVVLLFGENVILSHRDIIVDKKYYKFAEIPAVCASAGAIGTFFSEVEGYGNNLLEMMSFGLPVVINRYEVYKEEIEQLNFRLPYIDNCKLTPELVNEAYDLLINVRKRNNIIRHNLEILDQKLSHEIISEKLTPLIVNMFTKELNNS